MATIYHKKNCTTMCARVKQCSDAAAGRFSYLQIGPLDDLLDAPGLLNIVKIGPSHD